MAPGGVVADGTLLSLAEVVTRVRRPAVRHSPPGAERDARLVSCADATGAAERRDFQSRLEI
jgi:hypothetical protein